MKSKWMKIAAATATAAVLVACGGGDTVIKVEKAVIAFWDQDHGMEPWVTDAEVNGTALLKDVNEGEGSSYMANMVEVGGVYYFMEASAGSPTSLHPESSKMILNMVIPAGKLWKTDGTTEGTELVKDMTGSGNMPRLFVLDGAVYILSSSGLWKSTGTAAGTTKVKDLSGADGYSGTISGNRLYFVAGDGAHGNELWSSDGTEAGTGMVKDIKPGTASSVIYNLASVGSTLYFSADDGTHGRQLWKSNGTEAGTVIVKQIGSHTNPGHLVDVDGVLYFSANDDGYGQELWKSDGTETNTVMVKNIETGGSPLGDDGSADIRNTVFYNHKVYFTVNNPLPKHELWVSDGTEAGTKKIKDLGGYINYAMSIEKGVVFKRGLGDGRNELWASDGTEAGTKVLHTFSGYTRMLHEIVKGNILIRTNTDSGMQLWRTDATEAGTVMLKESIGD